MQYVSRSQEVQSQVPSTPQRPGRRPWAVLYPPHAGGAQRAPPREGRCTATGRPWCRGPCRASSALRPCLAPPDQFSPGAAEGRPAHQAAADGFSPSLRSSASAHPHCRGAPRSSGHSGTSRASHVCRLLSFCLKSREGSDTDEVTEAQTEPGVLCSWPPDISFPGPHHQLTG